MKGMPGNVEGTDETQMPEKIYFPNGKLAAKAYDRVFPNEIFNGTGWGTAVRRYGTLSETNNIFCLSAEKTRAHYRDNH